MQNSSFSPQVGEVIYARLPDEECAKKGKLRPSLVLDSKKKNGLAYILVAKGTSQRPEEIYRGEFLIKESEDLLALGLHKPTKFQLRQVREIPLTEEWVPSQTGKALPRHLIANLRRACIECGLV